jgi:hypothetical protein
VIAETHRYANILSLLLDLPLGTLYFSWIVTGVSLAVGLMPLALHGIPLTIGLWYVNRTFMHVERSLAVGLLGEQIDAVRSVPAWPGGLWHHFKACIADGYGGPHIGEHDQVGQCYVPVFEPDPRAVVTVDDDVGDDRRTVVAVVGDASSELAPEPAPMERSSIGISHGTAPVTGASSVRTMTGIASATRWGMSRSTTSSSIKPCSTGTGVPMPPPRPTRPGLACSGSASSLLPPEGLRG